MISFPNLKQAFSPSLIYNTGIPFFKEADGHIYSNRYDQYSPQSCAGFMLEYEDYPVDRIYCPVEVDTEYFTPQWDINKADKVISQTLTIQVRAITRERGIILSHPDTAAIARNPVMSTGFAVADYLQHLGFNIRLNRPEDRRSIPKDLSVIEFRLHAFLAVADLFRIVTGQYLQDIKDLVIQKDKRYPRIEQTRRLIAKTPRGGHDENYVNMPWIISIDGHEFRVAISIIDTCAVIGNASLEKFAQVTGVELPFKNLFKDKKEKERMNVMYLTRHEDYDNYANGDLVNYSCLIGYMSRTHKIYKDLGLESYWEQPRLTIGATVARLFRATLQKHIGYDEPCNEGKQEIINLCKHGTSDEIKEITHRTSVFNAKVDGGRCRNNRPTDVAPKTLIVDLDINSCYGTGLKHQDYPLGRPVFISYNIKSECNEYKTLRQFLKECKHDLVPGLWQARVFTEEGYRLKYRQDYLVSWFPPKDISNMPTDTDLAEVEWFTDDNVGVTKILHHEVTNALITQEFLEWLDDSPGVHQRKELLDNLYVRTAMYYPLRDQCQSIDELRQRLLNHTGKNRNTVPKRGKTKVVDIQEECHAWYSVNMGDVFINKLLDERCKYSKHNPDEAPFNELFKLFNNTTFGDMVSPFFDISNACVGNNITARARDLAWRMEKVLGGYQTITDGCAFEPNKVVHPDARRLSAVELVVFNESVHDTNYKLKPLGGADRIEVKLHEDGLGVTIFKGGDVTELNNTQAKQWLADEALKHLKAIYPEASVLDKFTFEVKDIYDGASFHGTANYKFFKNGHGEKCKMRSYSHKGFKAYKLVDDRLELVTDDYHASEEFLDAVQRNPEAVPRSLPFFYTKILKVGEYKRNYESRWTHSNAIPGNTIEIARLFRECSLSQFTFQTYAQFQSWEKESKWLRDNYGQTYEMWFLNPDGTVRYKSMVKELDALIRSGAMTFASTRPAAAQRHLSREYIEHPSFAALNLMKYRLKERFGFIIHDDAAERQELFDTWYYSELERGSETFLLDY